MQIKNRQTMLLVVGAGALLFFVVDWLVFTAVAAAQFQRYAAHRSAQPVC